MLGMCLVLFDQYNIVDIHCVYKSKSPSQFLVFDN